MEKELNLSQLVNAAAGDKTGRSITAQTQDGVAELTNFTFRPSGFAVHVTIFASSMALLFKNPRALFFFFIVMVDFHF